MHFLETAIRDFFSDFRKPNEALLKECVDKIKDSIVDKFHTAPDKGFKIRMSNIGRDTRQLMLEKKYGKVKAEPEFLFKMLTGDIQEHVLVYILKSAGVELEVGGTTSIIVDERKIDGTWDLKIKVDNKIYDVKTASEWSFKNKFVDYETLVEDDSFGYIDQLIGYCEGEKCEPGGWIVLNKSTGQFKVIEYPKKMADIRDSFFTRVSAKLKVIFSGEMPPCQGIEEETYYSKPTGRKIIGRKCMFCDHKRMCHPRATLEDSKSSRAYIKPRVWYV